MEVILDNNIIKILRNASVFESRTGMARRFEEPKYRWKVGEKLFFSPLSEIEPYVTFATGNNLYSIGSFSAIASTLPINSQVGRYCEIAVRCSTFGFRHPIDSVSINSTFYNFYREYVYKYIHDMNLEAIKQHSVPTPQPQTNPIILGHDVWIGQNCILNGGIHISTGAVIAQNSIVTKDVPPYAIVAGAPAEVKKFRFEHDIIHELLNTKWWDYELASYYSNCFNFDSPINFLKFFDKKFSLLKKYKPKTILPVVDFFISDDVSDDVSPNLLITYFGTILALNKLTHTVEHRNCKNIDRNNFTFLQVIVENNKFSVVADNLFLGVDERKNIYFSEEKFLFDLTINKNMTLSIEYHDHFLSARKDGSISMMPHNREWEQFYNKKIIIREREREREREKSSSDKS